MIDWVVVLAAFCVGVALTAGLAAREEARVAGDRHPTTRLFLWVVPGLALALAGALLATKLWAVDHVVNARSGPDAPPPTPTARPRALRMLSTTLAASAGPTATPNRQPLAASTPIPAAPPRLIIPSLGVDEPVQPVLIRNGHWDLRDLGLGVGWLETTGAFPGDDLAMVLVAHLTVTAADHGPFAYLQKIKAGADVLYQVGGIEYWYAVSEKGRVQPDHVNKLYVPDGRSLLLVTCTDWDVDRFLYANRLMVRAVLVEQRPIDDEWLPNADGLR